MLHHFDRPISAKRVPKKLTLSETTIEELEKYAKTEGISASRAADRLISLGLKKKGLDDIATANYLRDVVRQEITAHYDRMARLIVHAGLEAGAAKEAAQQLFFLELKKLSGADDLEYAIGVDPDTREGRQVIDLYDKRKGRFRWRAAELLRKPVASFAELLLELTEYQESEGLDKKQS